MTISSEGAFMGGYYFRPGQQRPNENKGQYQLRLQSQRIVLEPGNRRSRGVTLQIDEPYVTPCEVYGKKLWKFISGPDFFGQAIPTTVFMGSVISGALFFRTGENLCIPDQWSDFGLSEEKSELTNRCSVVFSAYLAPALYSMVGFLPCAKRIFCCGSDSAERYNDIFACAAGVNMIVNGALALEKDSGNERNTKDPATILPYTSIALGSAFASIGVKILHTFYNYCCNKNSQAHSESADTPHSGIDGASASDVAFIQSIT